MKSDLNNQIEKLRSVFKNNDYRVAHEKAKHILMDMAKNKNILFDIIRQNLSRPGFFAQQRINPVIAFDIEKNKHFSIIAHCWLPLPDRTTDTSHQSVHHHGRLLLTSVSPLGNGYESVIFKRGYEIDKAKGLANMAVEKIYYNPQHNIEFIDSYTPHVVFYPADFSITYAMWSYDKKDGAMASLRQSKLIQTNKKIILKALRSLGLLKRMGVNVLEYFDFYPENGRLHAMQDRVMYPIGTNENFVHNLFYILQKVGFNDKAFILNLKSKLSEDEISVVEAPMDKFLKDELLEDKFDPAHLSIAKINFSKAELLKSVEYSEGKRHLVNT